MGHARAAVIAGCLLLFLTADASGNKCHSVGCHGMHGGKAYQEGHTYVYDLEGTSVTSVPGAQNDATLKLKGTVELSAKPNCIKQVRLKGVQVNGAPISLPDVEKYALQFNYHDGHIDTEVCAENGDSQESLNIKRAVASLFQSAIFQDSGSTTHHEIDVMGGCPTDFTFHKDGDSLVVQKERDLLRCSHRETIKDGPMSVIYDTTSSIQSAPTLESHQKIEQRFKRGILNKATSVEIYKLKHYSNGDISAKTVVQTTLTLKSEKGDSPQAAVSLPKSLIFEAPHMVVKSSVDSIIAALKAAGAEEIGAVKEHAAEKFTELIKVLRRSSKNDILTVYQKVRAGAGFDKDLDKKILLDALFVTRSGEAVEVAVDLIKNREITDNQLLTFYSHLFLVNHVNLPSITAVVSLMDQPDFPRIGYLGIGQVIGMYCREHTCENVPEIKQAIHKIREKIGNGKAKTREQETLIVTAVKALGNTRYLDDASTQKLYSIAEDKNVRNRVRVAVIEILPVRRSMKLINILLKILADRDEDSEIRIKAYLSLVACPCPHVAHGLKEILDKETVNQVGSYIQSHLRNLRASTDPTKIEAQKQLGLIKPRTKFPEDFRKYSFNNEFSYNLDAVGIGSSVESNVIYSQDSFVPRSVNLNMTTEVFGRSVNFLEIDTRVENLDRLIEHYFGPKGHLTQDELEDVVDKGVDNAVHVAEHVKKRIEKLRSKREVKQGELDKFAKDVKLRNNELDQQLELDFSIKMFGVEVGYLTHSGNPGHLKLERIIDDLLFNKLNVVFDKVKKFDYKTKNHMLFLDSEVFYPTNLGLPISIDMTGASVLHLSMHGTMDIQAMLKHPENAALHIVTEPSIAIQVAGTMAVKGFDVESGMKITGNFHYDTADDITIKLLDGNGIDMTFGTPKKHESITISSEVLLSSGQKNNAYEPAQFGKSKVYKDCFDQYTDAIGITACGHVEFPYDGVESINKKALYPLNGPLRISGSITSEDKLAAHLKIFYDNKSPNSRSFEILIDTPNSKVNRRISLNAEAGFEPDNKYAKIDFYSPVKKASAEAVLKCNPQENTLTITVHNDQQEYFARAGLLANGPKYKPVLEYKVPEHIEKLATKSGTKTAHHHGGQQYNVDGTVEIVDQDGGKKYVFDKVILTTGGHKVVSLDGNVVSTEDTTALDMNLSYGEESVVLKMNGKKLGEQHYSLGLSALPSKDPNIGFDAKWEYRTDQHEYENKLVFIHGPDLKSEINRLTVKQHLVHKLSHKDFILSASNKITYPASKMVLDLEGKVTPTSIEGEIKVGYEKFKLGTELSAKQDKSGDYEVEFEAELLQNSLKLESKRTVIDPHKSKYKNSIEFSPGGKYEAEAVVMYKCEKKKMDFELDGDLNLNGKKVKAIGSLNTDPTNVNSRASVIVNNIKHVDFILKLKRGTNPNGSLTLNLKNYLNIAGQMSMQDEKGNAHFNIDLPKINRKIKGTADCIITNTQRNANIEVLYDAERDPSKRIKLITINDLKENAIDTKNVLEVLNNKFELNGKSKLDGTFHDGELQADVDIILPNGRYVVYKIKRTSTKKDDNKYDIHVNVELADHVSKGGASRKILYVADASKVSLRTPTFQGNSQLKFVDFNGENAQLNFKLKNLHDTDHNDKTFEIALDLTGTHKQIIRPFNVEYKTTELHSGEESYQVAFSSDKDIQIKSSGNFVPGNEIDKPLTFAGSLDMILPSKKLRNVKLDIKNSFLVSEKDLVDVQGTATLTYNDDKTIKYEGSYKLSGNKKSYEEDTKIILTIFNQPPFMVHNTIKTQSMENEKEKISSNTIVHCNGKEGKLTIDDLTFNDDLSYVNLKGAAVIPTQEKSHNVDFTLNHERAKDGHSRTTDAAVTFDNEKYVAKSEIQDGNISPKIHIVLICPVGKTELLSKFEKLGDNEYSGEWKVETPYGFAVADAHVNLDSIDSFVINFNFDSDKLKHRKLHGEIANRPTAKTGRRIIITVTSDGKNVVTGSTNYKKREEAGKITLEGSGNLKIGENTRSSSFKYTRQQLTREKDGEIGAVFVLNAKFDPVAVVGELKLSNKEILVFNSYCEQSKDCAHFKLQSLYDVDSTAMSYLKHQVTVEVDLKKFHIPAEFGLKTNTEYKDSKFDHSTNLYVHSSKDKSEYNFHVYAHPKEMATILTLPSRELAVIGTFDLPKTKQNGAFKIELFLYLDRKNKPSEKTGLIAIGDANIEKDSMSLNGEAKFIYPSQPKDMAVRGKLHYGGQHLLDANLDIDVFAKKTQKIIMVAKVNREKIDKGYNLTSEIEVNSRGQQLKVDLKSHVACSKYVIGFGSFLSYTDQHQKPKSVGVLFSADSTEAHLLATIPNKELIRADAKLQLQKYLQKFDAEIAIVGGKPTIINFETKDWNSFKYLEYQQDNPNRKLSANGRIVLGQLAEIHADTFKDGAKKHLFHILFHLDEEKFLKPDFGYDKDNIMYALERYRSQTTEELKQLKEVTNEIANEIEVELKDLIEHLKKAQPNTKPLLEYYQNELNNVKNEFYSDKTIQDIQATLNQNFAPIIVAIVENLKFIAAQLEELQKQYYELLSQIEDVIKTVYPQLKESYNKILYVCVGILDTAAKIAIAYFKTALTLINEHQKDLKEIAVMISELTQDIAKIIFKGAAQIKKDVDEFVELLINQLKALPTVDFLKEKYTELVKFQIPQSILASFEEFCAAIKETLPTEELRKLFQAIYEYMVKQIKHEKVDDVSEIKKIYGYSIEAIQSLIYLLGSVGGVSEGDLDDLDNLLEANLPLGLAGWMKSPVFASLRVSLFNLLNNNELPTAADLYYTYRPTMIPDDIIAPFGKIGYIVDGGNFFTFDGKYFNMPGDCSYILVQDMLDGNFSVVANFNKGNLVSVTVTEPKESITMKNNGNILVNNKPADFPASTKNLHACIRVPSNVVAHIKSDYGVHVACAYNINKICRCTIEVSGFYHGRLRGLLGDGNNEYYDDYTLPSGKITESETEFANGYKLKPDCPTVNAIDHKTQQRNPVCTEYFSGQKSSLKGCFNYINPSNYRDACDINAAANPEAPCTIASAYFLACHFKGVMKLNIPANCVSCKVGENTINAGDSFSVKTPKNQADIILVIEQDTQNEKIFKELVPTLITDLKEEFKQHGITDVHVGLFGFGEHMYWTQYYTTNGNLNIEGEVKNIKFEESEPIITFEEAKKGDFEAKLTYLGQRLDVELGTFQLTDSYEEAINYPYRPGAIRAVVGIIANPCEKSPFPLSLQHLRLLQGQKAYRDLGLLFYHIYHSGDIQVNGKPQKNIVGYDHDGVYVLGDSKKKPLVGNTELKNNMVLPTIDVCAEFAVSSGGAAFSSTNLLDAKPNQKRQFVQVIARKIVEDLTSVELEQDCVCEYTHSRFGRPRCNVVGRREKEQLARHTKGGVKG